MKISLFDINHLNTMIRKNKAEKNNVVNEQETIQNNIKCRYRRPTPCRYRRPTPTIILSDFKGKLTDTHNFISCKSTTYFSFIYY